MSPPDFLRGGFGDAHMPDLAFLLECLQSARRFDTGHDLLCCDYTSCKGKTLWRSELKGAERMVICTVNTGCDAFWRQQERTYQG